MSEDNWARFASSGVSSDMTAPVVRDPTMIPPACGGLRIRKEPAGRDAINSRSWDFFHATPPTQTSSEDLMRRGVPVYMDVNPINTRTTTTQFRQQPQYIPDPVRHEGALGIPSAAAPPTLPRGGFYGNEYTQRMDSTGLDSRNMIRELRSAVVEDNRERQIDASRQLAARQFYDRWMPARVATDAASLQAYELLKPKVDDWRSAWAGEDQRDE